VTIDGPIPSTDSTTQETVPPLDPNLRKETSTELASLLSLAQQKKKKKKHLNFILSSYSLIITNLSSLFLPAQNKADRYLRY
jgi:hypothetical protein